MTQENHSTSSVKPVELVDETKGFEASLADSKVAETVEINVNTDTEAKVAEPSDFASKIIPGTTAAIGKAGDVVSSVADKTIEAFKTKKWLKIAAPIVAGVIILIAIIASLLGSGGGFTPKKTDEQLIRERIDTFLEAYNDGDMEEVLACLDEKTSNTFNALLNVMGGIAGGLTGVDIDLRDLFSLGVAIKEGDFITLSVSEIKITSPSAVATTTTTLLGGTHTIYFVMTYENDGWYISNMTDKKPASLNENTSPVEPGEVAPIQRNQFVDGVAVITYKKDNVYYSGIINTQGKIIYTTSQLSSYIHIGKGSTVLTVVNTETHKSELKYLINSTGNIVFEFEAGTELVSYGDGLALIYKRNDTITEIEHLYGVIDSAGNIVQPMTNMGTYNNEEHYYAGEGVFAIAVWTGVYHNNYVFWNSGTGKAFYASGLEVPPKFKNGVAFVYDTRYPAVLNPYNISDPSLNGEEIRTSAYFLLYTDGRFENYDMQGKEFKTLINGYLCYEQDDNENVTYVLDTTSTDNKIITYSKYPANNIRSIYFDGDYGLVSIVGANGSLYFTVIDKNSNQKFEPIETKSGTSSVVFSENTIIFINKEGKWCIADINGNVIVTEYASISKFSSGIAMACIGENSYDLDATWIYIDKNCQQVIAGAKP